MCKRIATGTTMAKIQQLSQFEPSVHSLLPTLRLLALNVIAIAAVTILLAPLSSAISTRTPAETQSSDLSSCFLSRRYAGEDRINKDGDVGSAYTSFVLTRHDTSPSETFDHHSTELSDSKAQKDHHGNLMDIDNQGSGHQSYGNGPDPASVGLSMVEIPARPHIVEGHLHGQGGAVAQLALNEKLILSRKGPDPLSYVEWDFAYGLGRSTHLQRFSDAYTTANQTWSNMMGMAGGRFRCLVDEEDTEKRREVITDIQSRLEFDSNNPGRHRLLLILHVVGCILSCFLLLPATLALRAANSNFSPVVSIIYLITLACSLLCSTLYKAATPRLYPANSHAGIGYAVFWLSLLTFGRDFFRSLKQTGLNACTVRMIRSSKVHLRALFDAVVCKNTKYSSFSEQYGPVEEMQVLNVDKEDDVSDAQVIRLKQNQKSRRTKVNGSSRTRLLARTVHFEQDSMPSATFYPMRASEVGGLQADRTAWWQFLSGRQRRNALFRSLARYTHVILARAIVPMSFVAAYTGLTVYTGSCRASYKNSCLAHGIKGGIFFWYGLLTFGRYLGAYADIGWAWNRRPQFKKNTGLSAEWVECLVIFVYGATNTWMERFGTASGKRYSVKEVQHISIDVMFWFAGLMGLVLESKSLRELLALPATLKQSSRTARNTTEAISNEELIAGHATPLSYSFSFNPFPSLVIGVTGAAMSAHHQDYVYEVSIHSLWGNLLVGFSVLRILSYFYLWLRPPTSSVMPSRPPSEALASFSLACGGLVFMLSSEEVSFAAMRNGFGDLMMILNVTVAVVSLLFCVIAGIMVLKAWALKRELVRTRHSLHDDASFQVSGDEASICC